MIETLPNAEELYDVSWLIASFDPRYICQADIVILIGISLQIDSRSVGYQLIHFITCNSFCLPRWSGGASRPLSADAHFIPYSNSIPQQQAFCLSSIGRPRDLAHSSFFIARRSGVSCFLQDVKYIGMRIMIVVLQSADIFLSPTQSSIFFLIITRPRGFVHISRKCTHFSRAYTLYCGIYSLR